MSFRLSKEAAVHSIYMGLIAIALGVALTWPMQINWEAIIEKLSPLSNTWWRVLLLSLGINIVALALVRKKRLALAEYVGTIAWLALFYPLLSFLAGLPSDLGIKALFFVFGGLTIIISLSAFIAITVLRRCLQDGDETPQVSTQTR